MIRYLIILIFIILPFSSYSISINETQAEKFIQENQIRIENNNKLEEKIAFWSNLFLGQPYLWGSLGEGDAGEFDQYPLFRVDAFDCQTLVETVLALSLSQSFSEFKHCMREIRYEKGKVQFTERNHFTSVDWNANNQRKGFLKDITSDIKDANNKVLTKTVRTYINKPAWYSHLTTEIIRLKQGTNQEIKDKLKKLQKAGQQFKGQWAEVKYIPLAQLVNSSGNPNELVLKQIPHGAVIEVVRENWHLAEKIGTDLDISHMGFAIWKNDLLYFREPSSIEGKIIDIPFQDYFYQAMSSPTIVGINVQVVLPEFGC